MNYEFETRLTEIRRDITKIEKYLAHAPAGRIYIDSACSKNRYYHVTGSRAEGNFKKVYIHKDNKELIDALVLKLYFSERLKDLKAEEKAIMLYESYMSEASHCEKLINRSNVIAEILSDKLMQKEQKLKEWEQEDYPSAAGHPEEKIIKTRKNIFVRSKSESFYIETLTDMNVALRYEQDIDLNGRTYNADIVARPGFDKEIIIEHLGMLDDEKYRIHNAEKIKQYILAGYIPGVNLILVGETRKNPLSLDFVRRLMRVYFGK